MALNFGVLQTATPVSAFFKGQEDVAQNALAQQKMAQEQEMNALRRQQMQVEMEGARLGQERTRGLMAAAEEDRARARRVERANMFRERLLRARNPEAARNVIRMQYADPDLAPVLSQASTLKQALDEVPDDLAKFMEYIRIESDGMAAYSKSQEPKMTSTGDVYDPATRTFIPKPQREAAPPPMVAEYQFAQTPQGGGFRGSYQDFVVQREAAKRPPPQPREPTAQKAPAGYRFTPSGDLEPIPGGPASPGLAPKDIQKREAAYPQATQAVKGFETKSEQFIKELESLRDDPGLDQITGPIYGRTPSVSRAGSRAQALYDKIFAKGGFQALQDMREASKTGGALGNVSNEEGRRLEKSVVGGLDRTQNIADVQQGINNLIEEIRVSQARVREAYDSTYEYRTQRGGGGGAKQMSPQDKQALDWANSNPKDPRAAQIKARLGVQ